MSVTNVRVVLDIYVDLGSDEFDSVSEAEAAVISAADHERRGGVSLTADEEDVADMEFDEIDSEED